MNKNNNEKNDFDYTIVMDKTYIAPDPEDIRREEAARKAAKEQDKSPASNENQGKDQDKKPVDFRKLMDGLYDEYERMCFKEPTVLDKDDIYPHSYQWRARDKYDPSKKEVLEEALKLGVKIIDTPAYEKYAEEVKKSSSAAVKWD
jgi:hypothetical protein